MAGFQTYLDAVDAVSVYVQSELTRSGHDFSEIPRPEMFLQAIIILQNHFIHEGRIDTKKRHELAKAQYAEAPTRPEPVTWRRFNLDEPYL